MHADAAPDLTGSGIAIIGMACRLPGANSPDTFWDELVHDRESIRWLSDDALRAAGVPEALRHDPAYVPALRTLDGVDQFDAGFFGLSPRDAAIMDPQHRHFLECCWEALEHGGCDPTRFDGAIGVFGGSGHNAYLHLNLLGNAMLEDEVGGFLLRHTGNDKDFLCTRVSYALDLRGPSVSVQTACSTSLVAVHLAASSLLARECDLALAGGVTIELPQDRGYLYRDGEILSADGYCRPFDRASRGTVFGSGAGVVALRRLDDALAAGDTIHAVIIGSAINNDGAAKASYLAPGVDGQAAAIREALVVADVDPATVRFIECHATGTVLGDAIEVAALRRAYGERAGEGRCLLGSVKANVGHLDTAAGVAGLIKTALAMQHRTIPGTLHFEAASPECAALTAPFVVERGATPWSGPLPLRAGVNSLGVGGTNAHVLLESAPPTAPAASDRAVQVLPLSARSAGALRRRLADLRTALDGTPHGLPDIAHTLQQGRRAFAHRIAITATSVDGARRALQQRLDDPAAFGAPVSSGAGGGAIAMLFAGGGASYPGMGRDLYAREPAYRAAIDRACAFVKDSGLLEYDLRDRILDRDDHQATGLERPTRGLPTLFVTQYACAQLWEAMGIRPAVLLGHSVGEYAAACVAGVLSLEDALRLVIRRAELFESLPDGAMLSVLAPEREMRALLPPAVSLAAVNAPDITVVAGPVADVHELESILAARGIEAQRIPISVAAHSAMLDPILDEFREAVTRVRLQPPRVPIVSNLTGTWLTDAEAMDPGYWVRQLREPVRFADGLARAAGVARVHLEVGPGATLSTLARQQPAFGAAHVAVSTMRHVRDRVDDHVRFHEAVGALWSAGVPLEWSRVHDAGARRRVPLPTYPWDHERHWFEPSTGARSHVELPSPERTPTDSWFQQTVWEPRPVTPVLPSDQRYGLCVVGEDLDHVFAAMSNDVEGRRIDGRAPDVLRETLSSLRSGLSWYLVSVIHSGDDGPQALERAILDLKHHAEALLETAPTIAGWRILVRGAATPGLGGADVPVSPVARAAMAAARVLRTELEYDVRVIDYLDIPTARDQLLAELVGGKDEVVAVRGHQRYVPVHRALPLPAFTPPPARGEGCCVITGGLGGLALALADQLIDRGWTRIALLARHPLPGTPADLAFHAASDSRSATRAASVERLRARGARVEIWAVDVADARALRSAWSEVEAAMGPVALTLHTAGMLHDRLVGAKTDAEVARLLAPKSAAPTLASLTRAPLVLFSSTSAVTGLPGQFDYAAANAYLDGIADDARAVGRPVLSVGWGVWRDVGMAARLTAAPVARPAAPDAARTRRRGARFERVITSTDWIVAEHRTRLGTTLLPGTALLALLMESLGTPTAALRDVALLHPLILTPGESRVVQVARDGDRLTLRSARDADAAEREEWIAEHAEAWVGAAAGSAPTSRRGAYGSRWGPTQRFAGRAIDHPHMDFGSRWACVDGVRYGDGEALVQLSLDPELWSDTVNWPLHPALLDMAIGAAQDLVPSNDPQRDFFVPQSYRSVRLLAPLAATLVSHVRRTASGADHAEFDIDIADDAGRALMSIEGFRLRRLDAPVLTALRDAAQTTAPAVAAEFVESVAQGITPAEAGPLLLQLIGQVRSGAVLVAPTAIADLRLPRAAGVTPLPSEPALAGPPDTAGSTGGTARRRTLDSEPTEPRSPQEQQLARLWQDALGIDAIGIHDDFFALGGHSLLLTRLASRARRQVGVTLPLARLFETPTIAGWFGTTEDRANGTTGDWGIVGIAARESFIVKEDAR